MDSNAANLASKVIDCLYEFPATDALALKSLAMEFESTTEEAQSASPSKQDLPPIYAHPVTEEVKKKIKSNF